ncbi:MAG: ABC transporter ATP-binding protein, partial [Neisseriaceae bacterium]|nr:ABC transporter ATP-binding protein [Neisseriaceae bacterium]
MTTTQDHGDIAISVKNITKIYKLYNQPQDRLKEALHPFKKKYHHEFNALSDISFDIKKGQTVGIIGKNGAGKSTLLKIITGVLTPTSGSVTIHGKVASLLELGTGFNPEYSGLENIYFQGSLMGFTKEEIDSKVDAILAFADIGEFIHQPVKMYSSGMFARLAFSVAINVDPDILIVDEALSVGDFAFQAKCFNKFKEFQEKNKTILFVTHSVDLIIKYCQSCVLIHGGKVFFQGDTKIATESFRKLMVSVDVDSKTDIQKKSTLTVDEQIKLFNLRLNLPLNQKANVYGSKEAEIIDFGIFNDENVLTNFLMNGNDYVVVMTIKFYKTIIDPIFAYTIKAVDGMELTGTNSMNQNMTFETFQAGDVITVKFKQKMILNAGTYFLA